MPGLTVTAEGVDTAQGRLSSRPVPADGIAVLMEGTRLRAGPSRDLP
ncbi:hypothetical protein [Streptomyces sp. 4F14]